MTVKHYPVVGVGALVERQQRILLVKRGKPPFKGQWSIPGGKVRFGESLQRAAEREIQEETGIVIRAGEPVFSFDIIDTSDAEHPIHYVVIDLIADYVSGDIRPGSDVMDVVWLDKADISTYNIQETTLHLLQRWWNSSSRNNTS